MCAVLALTLSVCYQGAPHTAAMLQAVDAARQASEQVESTIAALQHLQVSLPWAFE